MTLMPRVFQALKICSRNWIHKKSRKIPAFIFLKLLYWLSKIGKIIMLSALPWWEEVNGVTEYIISFVVSVVARLVGHLLCKWVDKHSSDKQP